jgi:protein SCO1/2
MSFPRTQTLFPALAAAILLAGCAPKGPSPEAKRYGVTGTVVAVDPRGQMLIVKHQEIPGYMAAMTMGFVVKEAWVFNAAHPGDKIQATLVVDGGKSWLEQVVITEQPKADPNRPAEASTHPPEAGEAVPDFELVNQDGKRIGLRDYRGKALVITFIYTRCPLPDYCPLMSKHFAAIAKEISEDAALKNSTRLLSISIDPEYDQPGVLRDYARRYGAAKGGPWDFATGKPDEVRRVAKFFGLDYWQESGQIIHALVTAVIDGEGKIVRVIRGNEWKPAEVIADIKGAKRS